jgi:AcrR family transcriptional regulator
MSPTARFPWQAPDVDIARRGRPRNEQSTADILAATLELVAEVGLAALTMDAVAARAGVSKATIYRRWSSKEQLLLDAWMSAVQRPIAPDTGTLHGDLTAMLAALVDNPLAGADVQRVYPQMVAAAKVNPDVAVAYRAFIAERRRPMRAVSALRPRKLLRPTRPAAPRCAAAGCTWRRGRLRAGAPVLIWPQLVATARSAMVASSVSPLRWLITLV